MKNADHRTRHGLNAFCKTKGMGAYMYLYVNVGAKGETRRVSVGWLPLMKEVLGVMRRKEGFSYFVLFSILSIFNKIHVTFVI